MDLSEPSTSTSVLIGLDIAQTSVFSSQVAEVLFPLNVICVLLNTLGRTIFPFSAAVSAAKPDCAKVTTLCLPRFPSLLMRKSLTVQSLEDRWVVLGRTLYLKHT